MGPQIGAGGDQSRRRAFVLVDKDKVQGVFSSWDAAETYADENHFSLDRLLEFDTNSDHPDHLHLMAAKWGENWSFVGKWSKFAPYWENPPSHIRLDHYHTKGDQFILFRQCEFIWKPGLLQTINPMAPDEALRFAEPRGAPPESPSIPKLQSKLSPLKPLGRPGPPQKKDEPVELEGPTKPREPTKESEPGKEDSQRPLISEPEPPITDVPVDSSRQKPTLSTSPEAPTPETGTGSNEPSKVSPNAPKPKISFQKRKPLRLKSQKDGPKPIPDFKPTPPPPAADGDHPHSSVELAQAQLVEQVKAAREERDAGGKPRRIWPLRVLVPIFAVFICWGAGIFWVFKPEPTAQNIVDQVTTLVRARVLVIEPGQVFFQLPVDPIYQQRWVQSLDLDPIEETEPFQVPTYHALDTWQKGSGFVRPPYADVEVREWWDLRMRTIRYGFYHEWEDGSVLLLDLESDLLIGWSYAARLPDLLN